MGLAPRAESVAMFAEFGIVEDRNQDLCDCLLDHTVEDCRYPERSLSAIQLRDLDAADW